VESRRASPLDPNARTQPQRPSESAIESAPGETSPLGELDLQTLLRATAERLAEETGRERVAVWARRPEAGAPYLAAASSGDAPPPAPDREAWETLAALRSATDLCDPRQPERLRAVATRLGLAAAAPVSGAAGEPVALLLLAGPAEAAGGLRPRTLARLQAAARRLEAPLATAAALRRIGQLDAGVRRLDRLASLGDLLAEIAHEVRNPLVSVKTFLQLLPERADDPQFRDEFLALVQGELRRIERLLDVVLAHARPRASEPHQAPADVAEAVRAVAQLVGHRALDAGVELVLELASDLPAAAIGEDALRQVLLNLALNAIDASADRDSRGETGRIEIRARRTRAGVAIEVCDRGPGVPRALRERIFEPFFSTKPERPGGLGLAISRRIVAEAGGRIGVHDTRGGGATFRVELPKG
jgi:signal transduction histidine kinase